MHKKTKKEEDDTNRETDREVIEEESVLIKKVSKI
jgi:hypothetical protein